MPSFFAPMMYALPDDDDNVYWPTKNHDIKNVVASFQKVELPPPPSEEECERIEQLRNERYNASWKDKGGGEEDEQSKAGNKDGGKRKRKEEDASEDTPRVKSKKSNTRSVDMFQKRMREKQGAR